MIKRFQFYLAAHHKQKLKTAMEWVKKVGILMKPAIDDDCFSCIIRGRHDNYVVYIGKDGVACSCPASRGHGYLCWHVIAVVLLFCLKKNPLCEKLIEWVLDYVEAPKKKVKALHK